MTLFRLDASIRTQGSVTREIADSAEAVWRAEHPGAPVVRRDIGARPLPADTWKTLIGAAEGERGPERAGAVALAASLADELVAADAYLFAVPLYNFGVPHHFKAWMDVVLTDPRFPPGGDRPLEGRPAVLVLARGGGYGPGTPRAGWDHAAPWLRRILADVLGLDLHVTEAELTLAAVNPAMAALRDLADRSLREAHDAAYSHGRLIATRVRAGV